MLDLESHPFLELALAKVAAGAEREEIMAVLGQRFADLGDEVEFDLALWDLAQRLRIDTEELLRLAGAAWLARSGLELCAKSAGLPLQRLHRLLSDLKRRGFAAVPVAGMARFEILSLENRGQRLHAHCSGPRRGCCFIEGVARAAFEQGGSFLRFWRWGERAQRAWIGFSLVR